MDINWCQNLLINEALLLVIFLMLKRKGKNRGKSSGICISSAGKIITEPNSGRNHVSRTGVLEAIKCVMSERSERHCLEVSS